MDFGKNQKFMHTKTESISSGHSENGPERTQKNVPESKPDIDKSTPNYTHLVRGTTERVRAWQYLPQSPIPVWVIRKFHRLKDAPEMVAINGDNLTVARPTDWIVDIGNVPSLVLGNEYFHQFCQPL